MWRLCEITSKWFDFENIKDRMHNVIFLDL